VSPTLIIGLTWLLVAPIVIGYPLVAGKIRMGGPGSDPITREGDPRAFWSVYALSTGLFLAISAAVAWFIGPMLP